MVQRFHFIWWIVQKWSKDVLLISINSWIIRSPIGGRYWIIQIRISQRRIHRRHQSITRHHRFAESANNLNNIHNSIRNQDNSKWAVVIKVQTCRAASLDWKIICRVITSKKNNANQRIKVDFQLVKVIQTTQFHNSILRLRIFPIPLMIKYSSQGSATVPKMSVKISKGNSLITIRDLVMTK